MAREERLAKLRQWLGTSRGVPPDRACTDLGVSLSTLKRDIAYLRDRFGVPVRWSAALRLWRLESDAARPGPQYELPGLWLSAEEIHALLTMQHLLANLDAGGLLGPHIVPLRKRIAQIQGIGVPAPADVARRIRIQTVGARRVSLPHFQALGSALLQRRRIHLYYRGRGSGDLSEREVSPQRLIHYRDNWYLDAWCHTRRDLRSFSVDAIEWLQVLGTTAVDVPDTELDDILGAGYGIFAGRAVHHAILRFSAERSRWVAAETWHPHQIGRRDAEGRWLLTIPYADPRELVMDILRHVPEVDVMAPQELKDEVTKRLRAGLQAMEGLDE
jgi:predicted DNA-binding transcriptional regulator YafY